MENKNTTVETEKKVVKKKKKNNTGLIVALVVILSVALVAIVILLISSSGKDKEKETESVKTEVVVDTETFIETEYETIMETEEVEPISIATSYGELYYPGRWRECVYTEIADDPYTVTFYASFEQKEKVALFDVVFNGEGVEVDKRVMDNGDIIAISINSYDIQVEDVLDETEINMVYGMCEDVNYLIENLSSLGKAYSVEHIDEEVSEFFEVETSYGSLYYPMMWEEYVYIEDNGDVVSFYAEINNHDMVSLFDITFNGEGDFIEQITLNDGKYVDVSIISHEANLDETWSEEEEEMFWIMVEDVNYLIQKLPELGK